jgi:hypothetical protein
MDGLAGGGCQLVVAMVTVADLAAYFGPASDAARAADIAHHIPVDRPVVVMNFLAAAGKGGGGRCDGGSVVIDLRGV